MELTDDMLKVSLINFYMIPPAKKKQKRKENGIVLKWL